MIFYFCKFLKLNNIMKSFCPKLYMFLIACLLCGIVQSTAQTITFDTVPEIPYRSESSIRYEPVSDDIYGDNINIRPEKTEPVREKKAGIDRSRLIFGGTFGLGFGNYTVINVSPQIGYAFFNNFSAGGGVSYNYYRNRYYDSSLSYLGLNVYARYNLLRYITLQVQPEGYYRWGSYAESRFVPAVLVGAGAFIPTFNGSGLSVMFYYDVVQDKYSPYGEEIFYSVGYTFRF